MFAQRTTAEGEEEEEISAREQVGQRVETKRRH